MTDVRLITNGGETVTDAEMPTFTSNPTILFWGVRVFQRDESADADDKLAYRECFYYAIVLPELPTTPVADIVAATANTESMPKA